MFESWTALGNEGWDFETFSPYYKKFETFSSPDLEIRNALSMNSYLDDSLYGKAGNIQISIAKTNLRHAKLWPKTFQEQGMLVEKDPRSFESAGAFSCPNFIDSKTSTRSHAGVAYWEPIAKRPNVFLQTDALVHKVILQKMSDGTVIAQGVEYSVDGELRTAMASKEVVLSSGAFSSPALLELSGIGDAKLLRKLGIDVVLPNSNVGENLQDHPMSMVAKQVIDENDSLDSLRDPEKLAQAMAEWQESRSGVFSMTFNAMAMFPLLKVPTITGEAELRKLIDQGRSGVVESPVQKQQADLLSSILLNPNEGSIYLAAAPADIFPTISKEGYNTISLVLALMHPFSRGSTHIGSRDAGVPPMIDAGLLSHPLDLEIMAHHLLHMVSLYRAAPFSSLFVPNGKTNPAKLPTTIEEAKDWLKATTGTQYHPSGTCAMMPAGKGGVVSDKLIVHGTKNLRVVDASVFPMIPKGPFTTTVYALAERAADLIKEAHVSLLPAGI